MSLLNEKINVNNILFENNNSDENNSNENNNSNDNNQDNSLDNNSSSDEDKELKYNITKQDKNYNEINSLGLKEKKKEDIEEQTKIIKESLLYLINLLNNCIERGGFQITEVIIINDSIKHLTNNKSSQEEQKKAIVEIIKYIYKAQLLGKLSLEEAYNCHLKVKIFFK
jgi:hypothetical protein